MNSKANRNGKKFEIARFVLTDECADEKRDDLDDQNDRDDDHDLSIRKMLDDGAGHFECQNFWPELLKSSMKRRTE